MVGRWIIRIVLGLTVTAPGALGQALDTQTIVRRNERAVVVLSGKNGQGEQAQGSGCCVDTRGYILSTAHQVNGVQNLVAQFKTGEQVSVEVVTLDQERDLALAKAARRLPAAVEIGDVEDLSDGSDLVAISTPHGLSFTVSRGIVSNLFRRRDMLPQIQTDFNLTGGSSGGPVFDNQGRLIGIISAKIENSAAVTLVTPINQAFPMLEAHNISINRAQQPNGYPTALAAATGAAPNELRAIEAFNRGVTAQSAREKVTHYTGAIRELRTFYEAWFNLAVTHAAAGQDREAIQAYRVALQIRPDALAAYRNLGRIYLRVEDLAEAVRSFEQATRIAPTDPGSHNDYGETLRRLRRFRDAEAEFRRALELKPDYAAAYYNLGLALAELGDKPGAIAAFRAYLEYAPDASDAAETEGIIAELEKKG